MPPDAVRPLPVLLAACLLAACGAPQDDAAPTPPSSTAQTAAPEAADERALRAYDAAMVAAHGQDLTSCPQAEAPEARACAEGDGPPVPAPRRVLLMLDASGSMAGRQGGQTKLAIAQDALLEFATRLDTDVQTALRVYGHRGGNRPQDKAESCRATELVQPFAPHDPAAFEAAVRAVQPRGFTPIAASLEAAARDFRAGSPTSEGNIVYLVSDGIETCDGDPAAAARALRASAIGVVVNVVGFDVDADAERALRGVAEAGGGDYVAARDRDELVAVFNQRLRALNAHFNCRVAEAAVAFNRTVATHAERFNCLVDLTSREFNAVVTATTEDFNAGRASMAQRAYAVSQARARRAAVIEPARSERAAAVSRSRTARTTDVDAARADRDAAEAEARAERAR